MKGYYLFAPVEPGVAGPASGVERKVRAQHKALSQYVDMRNDHYGDADDALFLDDKGKRVTDNQVYHIVRKYLTMVTSLKKRSPHVLRHTFATAMLNNGAGLESIKNLLGHESVSTTEIYTHTTFEQLKRIYKEAHPRA